MSHDIDYIKIGQRIRKLRLEKGLTQAELGEMAGCSNNYLSHIETGQSKVSLSVLLKISCALETSLDFFLLDTPFSRPQSIIDREIAGKLAKCSSVTLLTVNKIIDVLLEQQYSLAKE
ncbi:MAG: helix-turn-helix transcriptional regulator [Syntrophomonadaceae bacterium]|nr:helix-turn-helix transcriptional regulator [Syntrophomonadaceae bacterium]